MKKTVIIYRVLTWLFAALMLFSSIPDILLAPDAIAFIVQLGYPHYFVPFIGVAKALGVVAILVPGYPRLREWAYAGLMFDLIGAFYSAIASGGSVIQASPMLLFIALGLGSYFYWHRVRSAGAQASTAAASA